MKNLKSSIGIAVLVSLSSCQKSFDQKTPEDEVVDLTTQFFQFVQDDIKGIMQGKDHGLFLSVLKAGFAAHIRIDQAEGFGRQRIQLQIPCGMVGGDVADLCKVAVLQPVTGIVIVQMGDVFARAASVFPDIMGDCGSRDE